MIGELLFEFRKDIINGYSKRHFCSLNTAKIKVDNMINEIIEALKIK